MNVLLVNPPCRAPVLIPLGLGYIASVLRDNGHRVSLVDLNAEKKMPADIEKMLEGAECDIIGIGGLSTTYSFVKDFSNIAKKIKPKAKIIAGNMVSTAHSKLLLENSSVDICVIDEGEETIAELIKRISEFPNIGSIKGIAFKDKDKVVTTPPRQRIKDLDELPHPAWDLFSMETYINNPIYSEYGRRSINVSSVRGCPFQCVYCSRPFGSAVYMRSVGSVIEEIRKLKTRYNVEFIGFSDDMFTVNKKWVSTLCDALVRENVRIAWGASGRVNLVDPKLLKSMRKAGCEVLSYGFESGSQKILDNMKKGVTVEQSEKAIYMTRKSGISVQGSFMIGMIGESEETVNETIDFIKRTNLALHRFFYTTPYPCTPLYDMAKEMGRIRLDEDTYVGSLGEMGETLLANLTEMQDEDLKNLKERAEKKIKNNFSLRVRMEILNEELKRITANLKDHIKNDGLAGTLGWLSNKATEKIKK